MKLERQTKAASHLEWQFGVIVFRSILATIGALLLISSVTLWDSIRTGSLAVALVCAAAAIVGLLSWRSIYPNLTLEVSWQARALRLRLRTLRLNHRAHLIRKRQTQRMLSDLEDRRKYVKVLLRESSQFRELMSKLSVIVFRGQESPLATLIFSDSLEEMGFRVHHIENFENLLPHEVDEILKPLMQPPVERRVMVLGQGIDDQTSQVVSHITHRSVDALTIPFYSISRHGLSLFEKEQLHDIPTELYLNLKEYIERAASLARGPDDTSLDHRPAEAPRAYR